MTFIVLVKNLMLIYLDLLAKKIFPMTNSTASNDSKKA